MHQTRIRAFAAVLASSCAIVASAQPSATATPPVANAPATMPSTAQSAAKRAAVKSKKSQPIGSSSGG